jgi:hypothetical protein
MVFLFRWRHNHGSAVEFSENSWEADDPQGSKMRALWKGSAWDQIVKGYEPKKGKFVVFSTSETA